MNCDKFPSARKFTLFCAYQLQDCGSEAHNPVRRHLCGPHALIPAE